MPPTQKPYSKKNQTEKMSPKVNFFFPTTKTTSVQEIIFSTT